MRAFRASAYLVEKVLELGKRQGYNLGCRDILLTRRNKNGKEYLNY
jgi:hypothetical protein